jgi:hypothetical protein
MQKQGAVVADDITVDDNPEAGRYEIRLDKELAGFAAYRLDGDRVVFTHTEVDDRFEGHGLGSRLAAAALDDVRAKGREATPICPFIAAFIRGHQDYVDLVDAEHRAAVTDGG